MSIQVFLYMYVRWKNREEAFQSKENMQKAMHVCLF